MRDIHLRKLDKSTNQSTISLADNVWHAGEMTMDEFHILKLNGAVVVGDIEYSWVDHPEFVICASCNKPVHIQAMHIHEEKNHHYVCLPVSARFETTTLAVSAK